MGAWSSTPFGNDSALDWLGELQDHAKGSEFILETLSQDVSIINDDVTLSEEVIAACQVVSAAAVEPIGRINAEAKAWIKQTGFVPSLEMLRLANNLIKAVVKDSELGALWEESYSLKSWQNQTLKILENLEKAEKLGLPRREPKIKREVMPKLLYKLLEYYKQNPTNEKVRRKIREKVLAITDVNKSTKETYYKKPVELIAQYGLEEEFYILLEKGANIYDSIHIVFVRYCIIGNFKITNFIIDNYGYKPICAKYEDLVYYYPNLTFHTEKKIANGNVPLLPEGYCPALFGVSMRGNVDSIKYLQNFGASLQITDINGESLYHFAVQTANIPVLEYLFENQLNIDKQKTFIIVGDSGEYTCETGDAPLHFAVRYAQFESVKWLLQHDANPNVIEKFEGKKHQWHITPLDIAQDKNIIEILKSYGAKTYEELQEQKSPT